MSKVELPEVWVDEEEPELTLEDALEDVEEEEVEPQEASAVVDIARRVNNLTVPDNLI